MISRNTIPLFRLGRVVATPGAIALGVDFSPHLHRHERGDWGESLSPEDFSANDEALADGGRILSCYESTGGVRFYIITEADRSVTTVLLPSEY